MIQIPYYETSGFVFSNFSAHRVLIDGADYPTVEHAFHAQKFDDPVLRKQIQDCPSPLSAWKLAHTLKPQRRADWNEIKVIVLTDIIRQKVAQHQEVRDALIATGNQKIVEVNPHDSFWGNGPDGNGQNHTGQIIMKIRSELQSS